MINYRSVADLMAVLYGQVIPKIGRTDIAAVWGVPRSGMLPASILATHYHAPLGMAGSTFLGRGLRAARHVRPNGKVHLLVEDCVGEGGTLRNAKEWLFRNMGPANAQVISVAPFANPSGGRHVDVVGEILPYPQLYEWNWLNSDWMPRTLFDMDGVICEDYPCTDESPRYIPWLNSARPLFVPAFPVLGVVTSRLESNRAITAEWLARHGVTMKILNMHPAYTPEERARCEPLAVRKGEFYRDTPEAQLFVESHEGTAFIIHKTAGKPVLCTGDGRRISIIQ